MMLQRDKSTRILGVDPGTNLLGHAVIEIRQKNFVLLEMDVLSMKHLSDHQSKLKAIYDHITVLIQRFHPEEMAIEAPFFGKNVQSMLKLGRAQGVAMAAGLQNNLSICEYSPRKIKKSVCGNGNASKEQVAAMLNTLFQAKIDQQQLDATDALATAVCHHFQSSNPIAGKSGGNSWSSFLKDNPNRIR